MLDSVFILSSLALQLSSGWDEPMGSLVVPVKELFAEPQLVKDQWFHLDGASTESQILLRAELKVRKQTHALVVHTNIKMLYFVQINKHSFVAILIYFQ